MARCKIVDNIFRVCFILIIQEVVCKIMSEYLVIIGLSEVPGVCCVTVLWRDLFEFFSVRSLFKLKVIQTHKGKKKEGHGHLTQSFQIYKGPENVTQSVGWLSAMIVYGKIVIQNHNCHGTSFPVT